MAESDCEMYFRSVILFSFFLQQYMNQNQIPSPGGASYPGAGVVPNKGMPPPPVQQSRRHPDFAKDSQQSPPPQQSYSPYNNQQPRPMFAGKYAASAAAAEPEREPEPRRGTMTDKETVMINAVCISSCPGWPNDSANRNQYPRGPYPAAQANVPPNAPPQQWGQAPMPRAPVPPNAQPPPNAQWEQHRYPPNSQQQSFPPPQVSGRGICFVEFEGEVMEMRWNGIFCNSVRSFCSLANGICSLVDLWCRIPI